MTGIKSMSSSGLGFPMCRRNILARSSYLKKTRKGRFFSSRCAPARFRLMTRMGLVRLSRPSLGSPAAQLETGESWQGPGPGHCCTVTGDVTRAALARSATGPGGSRPDSDPICVSRQTGHDSTVDFSKPAAARRIGPLRP
jgi:hypothetical protein